MCTEESIEEIFAVKCNFSIFNNLFIIFFLNLRPCFHAISYLGYILSPNCFYQALRFLLKFKLTQIIRTYIILSYVCEGIAWN